MLFTRPGVGNLHSYSSDQRQWITSSAKCSGRTESPAWRRFSGLPPAYASISASWFFSNTLTSLSLLFGLRVSGVARLTGEAVNTALNIILPVGISFYTFHSMSYTIDVYRRKQRPISNFIDLALFVSFFPPLVAGPIVRAVYFLPQLVSAKRFSNVDVRGAVMLFLAGFI